MNYINFYSFLKNVNCCYYYTNKYKIVIGTRLKKRRPWGRRDKIRDIFFLHPTNSNLYLYILLECQIYPSQFFKTNLKFVYAALVFSFFMISLIFVSILSLREFFLLSCTFFIIYLSLYLSSYQWFFGFQFFIRLLIL